MLLFFARSRSDANRRGNEREGINEWGFERSVIVTTIRKKDKRVTMKMKNKKE